MSHNIENEALELELVYFIKNKICELTCAGRMPKKRREGMYSKSLLPFPIIQLSTWFRFIQNIIGSGIDWCNNTLSQLVYII